MKKSNATEEKERPRQRGGSKAETRDQRPGRAGTAPSGERTGARVRGNSQGDLGEGSQGIRTEAERQENLGTDTLAASDRIPNGQWRNSD